MYRDLLDDLAKRLTAAPAEAAVAWVRIPGLGAQGLGYRVEKPGRQEAKKR